MALEPLLPSERIELGIYRAVKHYGRQWTGRLTALVDSVHHFGSQVHALGFQQDAQAVVERLEGLYSEKHVDLTKWADDVWRSHSEWPDQNQFFYAGDFKVAITPNGQKYFEGLERREKVTESGTRNLVFISCGQATGEERALGRAMAVAVEELTEYEGYFAQNQTSLQGLSQHILGALNSCSAFVAVLHHRGTVRTPHGEHTRGSIWVEQEIAIAASRVHTTGQEIPVLAYIQKGIKREGLRDLLMLNAVVFESEDEVLLHFREALSNGKFLVEGEPPKVASGASTDKTLKIVRFQSTLILSIHLDS